MTDRHPTRRAFLRWLPILPVVGIAVAIKREQAPDPLRNRPGDMLTAANWNELVNRVTDAHRGLF